MASEQLLQRRRQVTSKNPEACGKCGGWCCKQNPCGYAPLDFFNDDDELDEQKILNAILAGRACLKYNSDRLRVEYIMVVPPPVNYDKFGINEIHEGHSRCLFLGENGCTITENDDEFPFYGATYVADHEGRHNYCQQPNYAIDMVLSETSTGWYRHMLATRAIADQLEQLCPEGYICTRNGIDVYKYSADD